MTEHEELQYRTELELRESFLRKVLKASAFGSSTISIVCIFAGLSLICLGITLPEALAFEAYDLLVKYLVIVAAAAGIIVFRLFYGVKVSLRRWKEQNHEEVVRVYGGFTAEGYTQGKADKEDSTLLHYADIRKLTELEGVWILHTKANLLYMYNAAALSETDRKSVLGLLEEKNPKLKIKLPKA